MTSHPLTRTWRLREFAWLLYSTTSLLEPDNPKRRILTRIAKKYKKHIAAAKYLSQPWHIHHHHHVGVRVISRMLKRWRFGGVSRGDSPLSFSYETEWGWIIETFLISFTVIIILTLNIILLTRPSVVCPKERRRILNKFRSWRYHRHHCRGCLREFITMMMIMMMIIPKPSNQVWQLESSRIPLRATPPKNF